MAIALDASTPGGATPTLYSSSYALTPLWTSGWANGVGPPAFSPPAGSLVVILANVGYASGAAGTFTCADSNAVSYTQNSAVNNTTATTASAIFYHYYASAPGSITVTLACTSAVAKKDFLVIPQVLTGAAAVQPGTGTPVTASLTSTAAVTASYTPSTLGSWVYLVAGFGGSSTSATPVASANLHAFYSDSVNSADQFIWGTAATIPTASLAAVIRGWTQSGSSSATWAAMEVLPAVAGAAVIPDLVMPPRIAS